MDERVVQRVVDDDVGVNEDCVDVVEDAGVDASAMVDKGMSMVGGSRNMGVEVVVFVEVVEAAEEETIEVEDALDVV